MFSKDDVAKADKFASFITKAKFEMSVSDWLSFHQHLVWYNGMIKKIQDHIFEPVKVTEESPKPSRKPKA